MYMHVFFKKNLCIYLQNSSFSCFIWAVMSQLEYSDRDCTVYVGGIDSKVTEEIIFELFLQAGPLDRATIPKDKESGVQKPFGFVQFTSPISVPYAIELLDGTSLCGKRIVVKPQTGSSTPTYSANRGSIAQNLISPSPLLRGSPILPVMRQNSYEQNNYGRHTPPVQFIPQHRNSPPVRQTIYDERQAQQHGRHIPQNYDTQHQRHGDYRRSNSHQDRRSNRR